MTSTSGGAPDIEAFASIARALLAEDDVQHTLQRIVDLAVETIDGCDHAGVSLLRAKSLETRAGSDDVPRAIDAIQHQTGEGPCLDAVGDDEVIESGDLGQETRWPKFAATAQEETGIASVVCFRLFVQGDTLGTLNLYSKAADAFDEDSLAAGVVFATHASVALFSALHDAQMEEALRSRDLIGQAKGMLMAREGVTADEAFDMLRRASQRLNVKLRDVAGSVVSADSGTPAGGEGDEGGA